MSCGVPTWGDHCEAAAEAGQSAMEPDLPRGTHWPLLDGSDWFEKVLSDAEEEHHGELS
jgi:hypothetical protein